MARINSKHKPLYLSKKRYVYEKGGRGSGKSYAITDYAVRLTYDTGRVILFMRYTMMAASISIMPEFEAAIAREGVTDHFTFKGSEIINNLTGSRIIFKGVKTSSLNQTANLKSIQGLTDAIYDEFEEHPDQESFDKLDESIREVSASNRLVLCSNALHKQSWQHREFWEPEGLYYPMTKHIVTTFKNNYHNLSESWHQKRLLIKQRNPKKYNRDYLGIDYEDAEGALWTNELIKRAEIIPNLVRVIVAIDPAVTSNDESDETGIIVAGKDSLDRAYILEDCSGTFSPNGWGRKAVIAYDKWKADRLIGEVNNGGDLIESVIRNIDNSISYKAVRASRGKAVRAEPVVSLYEEGRIFHVGNMPELEMQMTTWVPGKGNSPDRVDALVWAITELLVTNKRKIFVV